MNDDDPLAEARAIARVQDGDAEAYGTLVSKYLRRVVAIAVYIRDAKGATSVRLEAMQKIAEAVWKKWADDAHTETRK